MKQIKILVLLLTVSLGLLETTAAQKAFNYTLGKQNYNLNEKLVYSIKYGFIHGGNATITLQPTKVGNQPVYHAVIKAQTTGVADKLYRVEDYYESYFIPSSGFSLKYVQDIHEGDWTYYNEVTFDREKNVVTTTKSDSIFQVPANILDMTSLLYYLRRMDLHNLENGQYIDIVTFFDNEVFPFDFRYRGMETVKTKKGKIKCYHFIPVVGTGRDFKNDDDMSVYISADKNKVPIIVRFNLLVGSLRCELTEYKNLKYKLDFH